MAAPLVLKRFKGRGTGGSGDFRGGQRCLRASPGPRPECFPSVRAPPRAPSSGTRRRLTGAAPAASRALTGAIGARKKLGTDTGRSWRGFPRAGSLAGTAGCPCAPSAPDSAARAARTRPTGLPESGWRVPALGPLLRRDLCLDPGAALLPAAPAPPGVRRWVLSPGRERRAPHQQMVLRAPHPRGCGAPTDRTWPGSALPPPAAPHGRGDAGTGAGHGGRGPRYGRVTCPGVGRLLAGARGLLREAAADGENVRFGRAFLEAPVIAGSRHRSPARCHDLAPRADNSSRLHFCSAPSPLRPGGRDGGLAPARGSSPVPSNRAVLSIPEVDVSIPGTAAAAPRLSLPLVGHRWARRSPGKGDQRLDSPCPGSPQCLRAFVRGAAEPQLRAGSTEGAAPGPGVRGVPSPAAPVGSRGASSAQPREPCSAPRVPAPFGANPSLR